MLRILRSALASMLLAGLLGPACNSEPSGTVDQGGGGGDQRVDAQTLDANVATDKLPSPDLSSPDTQCQPIYKDCTGYCGELFDNCTGTILKCGGCPKGEVCNMELHTCVKPLINCADLKAECGTIKNSCGKHIDCGNCPSGKECDPDTNTCVSCLGVTCQDLGYECGAAWLGCGPSSNTTNCGTCPSGKKCNASFHVCEPACTPGAGKDICAAAKLASGVQCGFISDGCGGLVNCGGCPAGQGCGIYGVANRCEPVMFPDECLVLGKNCGQIDSACGGKLDCGTCKSPEVCNSNNVCGPACKPKTCADFTAQCGAFADGCNGTVTCSCPTGQICKTDHTCCTNTATCPAGSCATSVKNSCTGATIQCNTCTSNQVCDTTSKTCKPRKTCQSYGAGGTSAKCNDNAFYDIGNGTKIACPCSGSGGDWYCINDTATTEGQCCMNVNPGCPTSGPGSCNSSVQNSCTGEVTQCECPPGSHCEGDTCVLDYLCSKYNANGNAGDICSNDPSPTFPNGAGQDLTCPCDPGLACLDAAQKLVSGGATGTCVVKKTCADYSATGEAGEVCSNDPSPTFPDGAGTDLTCRCDAGFVCADGTDQIVTAGATGVCKLKKTCADYSADGKVGSACNDNKAFSDGFGGLFDCPCTMTGGFGNNKCLGDSSTQAGTCQCTPTACTCANSGLTDGCGAKLSCPCAAGYSCNTSKAQCCKIYSCTDLPPGYAAGACGTIPNSCLGTSFTCGCPTTQKPNNKCVSGTCQCTPKTCAELGTGDFPNDGCGSPIHCGG